jgi:hypothetical protein
MADANGYFRRTLATVFCSTAVFLAIPLCCLTEVHEAHAARENVKTGPLLIKVRLETKPEPTNAIGILLSTDGAKQITETQIQKLSDRLYEVSFEVDRKQLQEDSVATAMAVSAMGDISFANVTPISAENGGDLLGSIPDCAPEDPTQIATLEQIGLVQQLVGVKKQRAALAKKKVAISLDEETAKKIQNFEAALGLSNVEPISADLPPTELVDRLSRLNFAIKRYKAFKPRTASNDNAQ